MIVLHVSPQTFVELRTKLSSINKLVLHDKGDLRYSPDFVMGEFIIHREVQLDNPEQFDTGPNERLRVLLLAASQYVRDASNDEDPETQQRSRVLLDDISKAIAPRGSRLEHPEFEKFAAAFVRNRIAELERQYQYEIDQPPAWFDSMKLSKITEELDQLRAEMGEKK